MAESTQRSRLLWTLARVGVTVIALGVLFAMTDMKSVAQTLRTFPLAAALTTIGLAYLALGIGTVRWSILMRTCGATTTPPLSRLYRLSLIGLFYSTVLPGAVGGDVVRGLATAESFEGRVATSTGGHAARTFEWARRALADRQRRVLRPPARGHRRLSLLGRARPCDRVARHGLGCVRRKDRALLTREARCARRQAPRGEASLGARARARALARHSALDILASTPWCRP